MKRSVSHRDLVTHTPVELGSRSVPLDLDAVVVPVHHGIDDARIDHLRAAVGVAHAARSRLLVLCSGRIRRREVMELIRPGLAPAATVVDLHDAAWDRPLRLRTASLAQRERGLRRDVSRKRNLALLLGRMLGWNRVLFLDDDVRDLSQPQLLRGLHGLDARRKDVVGWAFDEFPDHSVVCHAHRLSGGRRETFVGGGALLVQCSRVTSFFPDVYNEDWLFLADLIERGTVEMVGDLTQVAYRPYDDPVKAAAQEFGDVLAEGLFWLLHAGLPLDHARKWRYWTYQLDQRRAFIDTIARRLRRPSRRHDPDARKALACLRTARNELRPGAERVLADYVTAWRQDQRTWAAHVMTMPRFADISTALGHLGLREVATDVCPSKRWTSEAVG
jgi:hypothetical protein